ncbi:MAG: ROK family protein [Heliobacteriaceae bacterium]|jgi:glucokinase|nr:ROK family protein [Heliobacteriaceae bacterium]
MKKALAIDAGGTKIYNTIVNDKGEIVAGVEKHNTPKTFEGILEVFRKIIAAHEDEVDIIAFATAGAVNNENTGIVSSTGNLPAEYPLLDFRSLSTKKVFVENDANAAAWAEHVIGVSKRMPHSVMLTLGTGVGGGIIVDNKLLKGKSGAAGEMHFKIYPDKRRRCTCGAFDCFEAYASGTGMRLTAEEISGRSDITTYDVIEGMRKGNDLMTKIFQKWQNDLLAGLAGLANIFDPCALVLSGSMAEFADLEYLEKEVNSQIVTSPTKVLRANAGNYAGMIGAALLGLSRRLNG